MARHNAAGDQLLRDLHRRVLQGDLGAVPALAVVLECRGQPLTVWVARFSGPESFVRVHASREGAFATALEWVAVNRQHDQYAPEGVALIEQAVFSGGPEAAIDAHNRIIDTPFWYGDEREFYTVEELEVLP